MLAQENEIPLCEAELKCLGACHASVGAYLLGLWGMADPIVDAVAFHHQPRECEAKGFSPLTAVYVANVLVNEARPSCSVTCDEEGMALNEHVVSKEGDILLASGQDVTLSMLERLKKFLETAKGVREPIRVHCPIRGREENQTGNIPHTEGVKA